MKSRWLCSASTRLTLPQFKRRDAEYPVVFQIRKPFLIHASGGKNELHVILPGQIQRRIIDFRNINKQCLTRHALLTGNQ